MRGLKDSDCAVLIIFTAVDLLNFIFRLGVVFAIYGFLWGLIEIGFRLLTSGRERSVGEIYLLRGVKYLFLADVTFLFCIDGEVSKMNNLNQLLLAAIILLTYFVGKLQNNQNRTRMFQVFNNARLQMPKRAVTQFNLRAEIGVIVLALGLFVGLYFAPQFARNPISFWFFESIVDIENTVFFGFIFKIVGFFFLLSMISKMINGVTFLLGGARTPQNPYDQNDQEKEKDDYDPWEEVK